MEAIIFGAGRYGKVLKKGLEKYYGVHICAICDNNANKRGESIDGIKVISPNELIEEGYEKIFVCVSKEAWYKEIKIQLLNMGISSEKIIIMNLSKEYTDAFIEFDPIRKNWIKAFADFTREIGLLGSTAECGVYRGDTSIFINKYWPDRVLHLFDTFEGFLDKDIDYDSEFFPVFKNGNFSKNSFKADAPDSLINVIKTRMLYPDKVQIHKGHFPESATNVNDRFSFVNLDMDLYRPQLEGLRFFWTKMEKGGVILLHDYYHPELPGVKKALADFEREIGNILPKFPIGDQCSMAVMKI